MTRVPTQVNLYQAKTRLSDLVERAAAGEEIVIAKNGTPRARLVRVQTTSEPRRPGRWKGKVVFGPGWDDDLADEFENLYDDALPPPV
jgi:prevent-host-death family protein